MSKPIDDALNTTSDNHAYVQKFNKHKDVPVKKIINWFLLRQK